MDGDDINFVIDHDNVVHELFLVTKFVSVFKGKKNNDPDMFPQEVILNTNKGKKQDSSRIKKEHGRFLVVHPPPGFEIATYGDKPAVWARPNHARHLSEMKRLSIYKQASQSVAPNVVIDLCHRVKTKSGKNDLRSALQYENPPRTRWSIIVCFRRSHDGAKMWFGSSKTFMARPDNYHPEADVAHLHHHSIESSSSSSSSSSSIKMTVQLKRSPDLTSFHKEGQQQETTHMEQDSSAFGDEYLSSSLSPISFASHHEITTTPTFFKSSPDFFPQMETTPLITPGDPFLTGFHGLYSQ